MSKTGRAALMLYASVLLIGSLIIVLRREPPIVFVAAHDLKANEMLKEGDVVARGRTYYARHPISKGQEIAADTVAAQPDVQPRENEITFAVTLARSDVGRSGLAPGAPARLCKDGKALEPVTMRLNLCAPDSSNCLGLAGIASTRAAELTAFFDQGPLPFVQPLSSKPACH
jgi:hypothetical protein